jgi:hypothetical protein
MACPLRHSEPTMMNPEIAMDKINFTRPRSIYPLVIKISNFPAGFVTSIKTLLSSKTHSLQRIKC